MTRVAVEEMSVRLIHAARRVIVRRGIAGTTREIASEAGVAEGTIYNYFEDKVELCVAVARSVFPDIVGRLPAESSRRSPRSVLVELLQEMFEAMRELMPLLGGVVGDPTLARQLRHRSDERNEGQPVFEGLILYLSREQQAGRIGPDTDPAILARMLLGTAFHHAFMAQTVSKERLELTGRPWAVSLVDAVLRAAGPRVD